MPWSDKGDLAVAGSVPHEGEVRDRLVDFSAMESAALLDLTPPEMDE